MFNLIIAAIVLVIATIGTAQADTTVGTTVGTTNGLEQAASAAAIISPGALTVNTLPASPITAAAVDSRIHTNQAASAAPAFGVAGIGCVKPGSGATLQVANIGAAVAVAGDLDDGCAAPRDINTMSMMAGQFTDEDKARRACAVPAIAKASPTKCRQLLGEAAPAPVSQRPAPWMAGG